MNGKQGVLNRFFLAAVLGIAVSSISPVLLAADAAAQQPAAVKEDWYPKIADFEFMSQHVEIPPRPDVTIIDSRPAARRYDVGHIPGAINIPDTKFDELKALLPEDKNKLLIFYCGGVDCILSHNSAFKAEKLGYKNIRVYAAGEPEWVAKGMMTSVSTAHVKKLIDEKANVMLVDSRPRRVFEKGAIPTAINIPDSEFDKQVAMLPTDKATPIIFYCGGLECNLSNKSAAKARKLGYGNVKTYAEGYPGWQKLMGSPAPGAAGDAKSKPSGGAVQIEPGKEKGTLSIASFDRLLKETPDAVLLVDTRDEKEFKRAAIKGSINIPIEQLEKKLNTLPADKPIIFVCGTGGRSGEAYDMVKLLRSQLTAYFLDADLKFNPDGTYTVKPH